MIVVHEKSFLWIQYYFFFFLFLRVLFVTFKILIAGGVVEVFEGLLIYSQEMCVVKTFADIETADQFHEMKFM